MWRINKTDEFLAWNERAKEYLAHGDIVDDDDNELACVTWHESEKDPFAKSWRSESGLIPEVAVVHIEMSSLWFVKRCQSMTEQLGCQPRRGANTARRLKLYRGKYVEWLWALYIYASKLFLYQTENLDRKSLHCESAAVLSGTFRIAAANLKTATDLIPSADLLGIPHSSE